MTESEKEVTAVSKNVLKQVDLGKLVESFNQWLQHYNQPEKTKASLECELNRMKAQFLASQDKEKLMKEELVDMKGMVEGLQQTMAKYRDSKDRNKELEEKIASMKEGQEEKAKENKRKVEELEERMKDQETRCIADMTELRQTMQEQAKKEVDKMKDLLKEKEEKIIRLQRVVVETESAKQAELLKSDQEHNKQLMKLQHETTKVQKANQMTAINQDIFRKKLQHSKAESEHTIRCLRENIAELEQRLAAQRTNMQPAPSGSKRRRY